MRLRLFSAGWCSYCILLGILMLWPMADAYTQSRITRLEYYVDTDPGYGNATALAITASTQLAGLTISLNPALYTTGMHRLQVRARDSAGAWSMTQQMLFYKPAGSPGITLLPKINYAEWFIDTDPGRGAANSVPLTAATDISSINCTVNNATLATGIHRFHFRARDSLGNWSLLQQWLFFKPAAITPLPALPKITYLEYYIDNDPGRGLATSIPITPATDLAALSIPINPGTLSGGMHRFHLRARDSLGAWSLTQQWLFVKPAVPSPTSAPGIAYAEWYLDNDPGLGRATPLSLIAGPNGSSGMAAINVAALSAGMHRFNTRTRDSAGSWSMAQQYLFYKPVTAANSPLSKIVRLEYYIDTDPGKGAGTPVSITQQTDISNQLLAISTTSLSLGNHKLHLRALDSTGNWSMVNTAPFTLISSTLSVGTIASGNCAGTSLAVPFTAAGTYSGVNVFRAQLSDASGSFSNATVIGTLTGTTSGTINATIPANTAAGLYYRVRVLSTAPGDTSAPNGLPIEIKAPPAQLISISGAVVTCADTQQYTLGPVRTGVTYTWAVSGGGSLLTSGGSNVRAAWTTAGNWLLTATSSNGCGSGVSDTLRVTVYGSPATVAPVLNFSGGTLYITASGPAGTTGYQWYRNDTLILSTIAASFTPTVNGSYKAAYVNACGPGAKSAAVNVGSFNKLPQFITFSSISNKTYGDPPFRLNATASSGLPVSYVVAIGPAFIRGLDTLEINGVGNIIVVANQVGDAVYNPATMVSQSFSVAGRVQTVSFAALSDRILSDTPVVLSASASSNLPVAFTIVSGNARIQAGNQLMLEGCGQVTVRANQYGSANSYQAAYTDRTFCVWPHTPDSVFGYAQSCTGVPTKYFVKKIAGVVNRWHISGGTPQSSTGDTVLVSWASNGTYNISVAPDSVCNRSSAARTRMVIVADPAPATAVSNLFPADSIIISGYPIPFSWAAAPGAGQYNLYIWPADTAVPATAVYSGSVTFASIYAAQLRGFAPGKWYKWKVVSDNGCSQASSTTRYFRISALPDLVVSRIVAPDTVFSGQSLSVNIDVKNRGQAMTTTTWYDRLYLSLDTQLVLADDLPAGSFPNIAALDTGQIYTNNFLVQLPNNLLGTQYIIAHTDAGLQQPESTDTNNTAFRKLYIRLTPPPDLRVTSVVTASGVFSGNPLNVVYSVKNRGPGSTIHGSWTDKIYISDDSSAITANAILLDNVTYNGNALLPDSAYVRTRSVTIPAQLYGRYYIHVLTDANNTVYENVYENNNRGRNDSLDIYLTPTPDYRITNFNAPSSVSAGELINLDWTVINDGVARQARDSVWSDGIYISYDSTLTANARLLGSVVPPQVLHPLCGQYSLGVNGCRYTAPLMDANESYYSAQSITIPQAYQDSFYLFVVTDHTNNIYEHNGETNNWMRRKVVVLRPDLRVSSVTTNAGSFNSGIADVYWTVQNSGPGKVSNVSRTDRITLSPTSIYNAASQVFVANVISAASLDSGQMQHQTASLTLPPQLNGTYYFFVETDYNDFIHESNETNNRLAGTAVNINRPAAPDLELIQVIPANDTLISDTLFNITYSVRNNGADCIGRSWTDNVYISTQATFQRTTARLLSRTTQTRTLMTGSSYSHTVTADIPMSLLRSMGIRNGICYFHVFTDADSVISEWGAEQNNTGSSIPVRALDGRHADLAMQSVSAPDTVTAGGTATMTFSVKNLGGPTGYLCNSWADGLYFSQDTFINAGSVFASDVAVSGPVAANNTYTRTYSFSVPQHASGLYYLLMMADHRDVNEDADTSNNYKAPRRNGTLVKTYVKQLNASDLVVTSLDVPATGTSGQPLKVKWTVKNEGAFPTNAGFWNEKFYLSHDMILDGRDLQLNSYQRNAALSAGASYTDSMELLIPITAQGNYYLLMKTDDNNRVYEGNNEGNNVASRYTFIILPPPADLVVQNVHIDSAAFIGDTVSIRWTLSNIGQNTAGGLLKHGVYFSKDSTFDNSDLLMTTLSRSMMLAPAAARKDSARFRVNGITPGHYTAIIRADIMNNIHETDKINNNGPSYMPIHVDVPKLPLDTIKYNVLKNNNELYYRIDVPATLQGETMLVTLKGDSVSGNNELYLRQDTIPSRNQYHYKFSTALSGNQEIVVPSLLAGTYYVMVYGSTTIAAAQQNVSLLAQKVRFSIRSVSSNTGGNTGTVTVRLDGAKYTSGMQARLRNTASGIITAQSVHFVNSTTVYASFNLAGRALGSYDVTLTKPGDSATLANSFRIVAGSGGGTAGGGPSGGGFYCSVVNTGVGALLAEDVQHPATTRINRVFPMTILYGNSGNVDIPIPTRMLVCTNGDPIALTPSMLSGSNSVSELFFEFKEQNGPPQVLRPGATGFITIYTQALTPNTMHFDLIEQ